MASRAVGESAPVAFGEPASAASPDLQRERGLTEPSGSLLEIRLLPLPVDTEWLVVSDQWPEAMSFLATSY